VFHLVALTIVLSILLHSSTDIVVAKAFDQPHDTPTWHGPVNARRRRRGPAGEEPA
jgi:sodium/hydrogen antiporter